jgi:hypothetical protein
MNAIASDTTGKTESRIGSWEWPPDTPIRIYEIGRWYRNGRGTEFTPCEPPRRCTDKPGYWVGPVLLRDGRVNVLVWGPQTEDLPETLRQRIGRAINMRLMARFGWMR